MNRPQKSAVWISLATVAIFVVAMRLFGAPATQPKITFDVSGATPRQVEDQTRESIVRDYGKAWQGLTEALAQNRPELLNAGFAGFAREHWGAAVTAQKKSSLSRKIIDRGHHLQALFYSVEGSAMQLRDTAQLEIQYLDNGKVIHSEQVTQHFIVLMTPAENSWKVRLLQEVPGDSTQQALLVGESR